MSVTQTLKERRKKRIIPLITSEERSEEDEWIVGIFGWPWPLLNVILAFIKRLRSMSRGTSRGQRRKRLTIYSLNRDPATGYITDIIEREVEVIE